MTTHILFFGGAHCKPCHDIKPIVEQVIAECGYNYEYINAEANIDRAMSYGISGVPALVVLRDGVWWDTICGPSTRKERVADSLRQYREG